MSMVYKLTKAKRASKASDDSNSIFGISAELEQNWREGVPLALQLQKKTQCNYKHLNAAEEYILTFENKWKILTVGWKPVDVLKHMII